MRRVSRNLPYPPKVPAVRVMPRMRRVSRNSKSQDEIRQEGGHASYEACG